MTAAGSLETETPPGIMRSLDRVNDVNAVNIIDLGETGGLWITGGNAAIIAARFASYA
ncbi:hypothetical protein [Xylella fastidiosa]|uniref:hypothetical protein n=1 Tax=Xylella fastidiosa TaxID=2371 RepID=UPI00031318A1|nr:hypothetical protein [Xylella fastidiosa]MDG5822555.1 hypothetical protein [Xylella fastidiosa subsp. pauca]WGZ31707.1 hypothetical protein O4444_09430 [Xylella fastidiosa subsp. pauca]